jgi:hypothetical protein
LQRLPPEVVRRLEAMPRAGFSARWAALQTDLWILVFATHPAVALELFRDQARAQANPTLRRLFLAYDRAHDLRPSDPAIDELARRFVDTTRKRYGSGDLPGQQVSSAIPALIQATVSAASPAWRRLDLLVRAQLGSVAGAGVRSCGSPPLAQATRKLISNAAKAVREPTDVPDTLRPPAPIPPRRAEPLSPNAPDCDY